MNKLKGKIESYVYVVSTMEEGQRQVLMDNLVMAVEKIEAASGGKNDDVMEISEQESVTEFCKCLLAILSHGLKVIDNTQKPSFWFIAARISPKDTIKMIYRMDIRQSDNARCQAWVRHALIEGTIGSYFTLLEEDTKLLKHSYRTSSFLRDLQMMESAKNIINNTVSSLNFNIKADDINNDNSSCHQVIPHERRTSTSSVDRRFETRCKGRDTQSNVVTIEDSFSSSYCNSGTHDTNTDLLRKQYKNLDTISLPGDLSVHSTLDTFHKSFQNDDAYETNKRLRDNIFYNNSQDRDENNSSVSVVSTLLDQGKCITMDDVKIELVVDGSTTDAMETECDADDKDFCKELVSDDAIVGFQESNIVENYEHSSMDNDENHHVQKHLLGGIPPDNMRGSVDVDVDTTTEISNNDKATEQSSPNDINSGNTESVENGDDTLIDKSTNQSTSDIVESYEHSSMDSDESQHVQKELLGGMSQDNMKGSVDVDVDTTIESSKNDKATEQSSLDDTNSDNSESVENGDNTLTDKSTKQTSGDNDSLNVYTNDYNALYISNLTELDMCEVGIKYEPEAAVNVLSNDINEPEKGLPNVEGNNDIVFPQMDKVNSDTECVTQCYPEPMSAAEQDTSDGNTKSDELLSIDKNTENDHASIQDSVNDNITVKVGETASFPVLNVFGSLVPSQTSAFEAVTKGVACINECMNENLLREDLGRISQNKVSQIITVINQHRKDSENCTTKLQIDDLSSSGSVKTEEEYRNQQEDNGETDSILPVKGASQLVNILNNVNVHGNHDDYFVPGIHHAHDIHSHDFKIIPQNNYDVKSAVFSAPPPVHASTNAMGSDHILPSPSALASMLLEKTRFSKRSSTFGSSYGSEKATDDSRLVCSDSGSDCSAGQSFSLLAELGISNDIIGMKEDHFSSPESFMGFSSLEELENGITSCKHLINASPEKSQRRDDLVTHLVQLRLKKHELKERSNGTKPKNSKTVLGHQFFKQGSMSSTLECDGCAATIFPLLQAVYVCKDCGFHCHGKCLKVLEKPCVNNKNITMTSYELKICPEIPLSAQQYRCADCFQRISMCDGQFQARLCDYTGQKYCTKCHWNDTFVIPARVVHNWDFSGYKVSRQSKHLLMVLLKKPDIKLQSLNAVLFNFVDELQDVQILRREIMVMKTYIMSCRIATEGRLLLLLQARQHFVDNSDTYSLQDLIDVHNNSLLNELSRYHAVFVKHIKVECLLCQGKGFICEYCNKDEIIFPFDSHVVGCSCKGIFHKLCYSQSTCPKCKRKTKMKFNEEGE